MTIRTFSKRATARTMVLSLLLATMLSLSGCGPIFSYVLCGDQPQKDMDCSTQEND